MTLKLKSDDVSFASKRSVDPNGKLFSWNGDLYRAISPALGPTYRNLLQGNNIQRLFDIGLIETEIAPIDIEGFDLVIKHRKIPFISYATEWCGSMLKDAALLTLDVNLALADLGLELQDAHPWNILFDGSKPKFIDFGSIVPMRNADTWRPAQEFVGMFFNPLLLMSAGCAGQARSLLIDPKTLRGKRVYHREVLYNLLRNRKLSHFFSALWQPKMSTSISRKDGIKYLREGIQATSIPLEKTKWSDYSLEEVDLSSRSEWIEKRKTVYNVISRYKPTTLLDIGSNTGWFSKLAAILGSSVIATDNDETCINRLYLNEQARKQQILPLTLDFRNPTPAYGIDLRCLEATERLRCEMVLGLAIVHHLVFKQKLKFDAIISSLATFTDKWLLVEFIPREDKYVSEWYDDSFSWYTEDNFKKELQKHFSKIEQLPSNPEPRSMFLCER